MYVIVEPDRNPAIVTEEPLRLIYTEEITHRLSSDRITLRRLILQSLISQAGNR